VGLHLVNTRNYVVEVAHIQALALAYRGDEVMSNQGPTLKR